LIYKKSADLRKRQCTEIIAAIQSDEKVYKRFNYSENDIEAFKHNQELIHNHPINLSDEEGSFSSLSSNINYSNVAVQFENHLQLFAHIRQLAQQDQEYNNQIRQYNNLTMQHNI